VNICVPSIVPSLSREADTDSIRPSRAAAAIASVAASDIIPSRAVTIGFSPPAMTARKWSI
jgi:hypothetical protein